MCLFFLWIVFFFTHLPCSYGSDIDAEATDDLYNAAALLMQDVSKIESEDDSETKLLPGDYTFFSENRHARLSFTLTIPLFADTHPAFHQKNDRFMLFAVNKPYVSSLTKIAIAPNSVKDLDQDELLLIDLTTPLQDYGPYSGTEDRAVYTVEKIPLMSLFQSFSYDAPFSIVDSTNAYSDNSNTSAFRCKSDSERSGRFLEDCGLNMNLDTDEPLPLISSIPILVGGARLFFSGHAIVELEKNGLTAGIYINSNVSVKMGLDMHTAFNESVRNKDSSSLPILEFYFPIIEKMISVSPKIVISAGYFVDLRAFLQIIGKYYLNFSIHSDKEFFIGFKEGKFIAPNLDEVFSKVEPATSYFDMEDNIKDQIKNTIDEIMDDLKINIDLDLEVGLHFGIEIGINVLGMIISPSFGLGGKLKAKFSAHSDPKLCTFVPLLHTDTESIEISLFYTVKSPGLSVPLLGQILEQVEKTKQIGDALHILANSGCLLPKDFLREVDKDPKAVYKSVVIKLNSISTKSNLYIGKIIVFINNISYPIAESGSVIIPKMNIKNELRIIFFAADDISVKKEYIAIFQAGTFSSLAPGKKGLEKTVGNDYFKVSVTLFAFEVEENHRQWEVAFPNDDNTESESKEFNSAFVVTPDINNKSITQLYNVYNKVSEKNYWTTGGSSVEYIPEHTTKTEVNGILLNDKLYRAFSADAYKVRYILLTDLYLNNIHHNLRLTPYILQNKKILNYSGTEGKTYPLGNNWTKHYDRSKLKDYFLRFVCPKGVANTNLRFALDWHLLIGSDIHTINTDVCTADTGEYLTKFKDGKVDIYYNLLEDKEFLVPVKYMALKYSRVVSYVTAISTTAKYDYSSVQPLKINVIKVSDYNYNVLHLDIDENYTNKANVSIIVEIDNPAAIEFLVQYDNISKEIFLLNVEVNSVNDNIKWISIPFMFKDYEREVTFTLREMFSTNDIVFSEHNIVSSGNGIMLSNCINFKSWVPVSRPVNDLGCVLYSKGGDLSVALKNTYIFSYADDKEVRSESEVIDRGIYVYYRFRGKIEKMIKKQDYGFVRYNLRRYWLNFTQPTLNISHMIKDIAIDRDNSLVFSTANTCETITIKTKSESIIFNKSSGELGLIPSREDHLRFIKSMMFSDATAYCLCNVNNIISDTGTTKMSGYSNCLSSYTASKNSLILVESEKGVAVQFVDYESKNIILNNLAERQFYKFINGINYYYYLTAPENLIASFVNVVTDTLYIRISDDVFKNNIVIKIFATDNNSSGNNNHILPITSSIYSNKFLLNALNLTSEVESGMYLDSGILYVLPQYYNYTEEPEDVNVQVLSLLCAPYVAKNIEIIKSIRSEQIKGYIDYENVIVEESFLVSDNNIYIIIYSVIAALIVFIVIVSTVFLVKRKNKRNMHDAKIESTKLTISV